MKDLNASCFVSKSTLSFDIEYSISNPQISKISLDFWGENCMIDNKLNILVYSISYVVCRILGLVNSDT